MKTVADTLAIARSNLIERMSRPGKPRGAYRKAGDGLLLGLIRRLVDERPSYGYRRITREVHPHSGLKFLSPREFLRLSA